MELHSRDRRTVSLRPGGSGVVVTLVLFLIPLGFGLALSPKRPPGPAHSTGRPLGQTHSVTLDNDSEMSGNFQWFVFGDYDNTLTSIGPIASGGSPGVSLPVDIDSSYVFYMDAQTSGGTAYLNASVTEDRLGELGFSFRFIQDDMNVAAVDPEDWPTPQYSPTPWDLTAEPTSTDEPATP